MCHNCVDLRRYATHQHFVRAAARAEVASSVDVIASRHHALFTHSAYSLANHSSVILSNPEGSIRRPRSHVRSMKSFFVCTSDRHEETAITGRRPRLTAFSYSRRQFFLRSLLTNCVAMHFKDSRVASDVSRSRERIGHRASTAAVVPQRHGQAGGRPGPNGGRACPAVVGRPAVNGNLHCCACRKARRPSSSGQGLTARKAADTIWLVVAGTKPSYQM